MTAVTALSEIDLANMALSNLGIAIGIQSLNDKTAEAKACSFWYAKCRDQILRSAPWNFAYLAQPLASDGSNVSNTNFAYPGWRFSYQYPNDCLQAVAVTTVYGQRTGQYYWHSYWGFPSALGQVGFAKIPFKVVQSTAVQGQRAILADICAPAYLWYIQCVTNTGMYDPLFCEAFSWLLAAKIGGPLRSSIEKIGMANQNAMKACAAALAQSLNEAQQDPARESPSISCR
jgi:hypothetical protein